MLFVNKHAPAKRVEMFIWLKNGLPKQDSGFINVGGTLIVGRIYFRVNRFWLFNRVILYDEVLFKCSPHFAGMFFLHVNIPSLALLF